MELLGVILFLAAAGCCAAADIVGWYGAQIETETAADDASRNIVGGEPTYKGEFPHHVAIALNDVIKCGGTIIDKRHVLTDAFCFFPNGTDNGVYEVYAGLWRPGKLEAETQVKAVVDVITHPKWSVTSFGVPNLAVLRVDRDFTYNKYVQPATLVKTRDEERRLRRSSNCAMVGFGLTDQKKVELPNRLRKIEGLSFKNYQTCNELLEDYEGISKIIMCAVNPPKSVYYLDGGGASVCRKANTGDQVVMGVASFTLIPVRKNGASYFTRVYRFRKWISMVIDRLEYRADV